MSHLQIIGKQMVGGYEFTGIEGGFGEGKESDVGKRDCGDSWERNQTY